MLNYRESERQKSITIRGKLCDADPGGGIYRKIPRDFVLRDPIKNLYKGIRREALEYFKENKIVWWEGTAAPTGHLLSSQISCLNHLFFIRNDKEAALKILQNLNPDFIEPCADFEGGYIGFEVVSNGSYLGETPNGKQQTRGANCTSVDAMMTGILRNGKKIQVLIEWKYTESYHNTCLADGSSGATRQSRYNHLTTDPDSPINCTVPIENLYYEPIYQIMRQTLLAWQMVKNRTVELNANDWIHVDIIPENNLNLRYQIQAPDLPKTNIEDAWKTQLKKPQKYQVITPQKLLSPIIFDPKYGKLMVYLNERYW
jgi:hypothetical protein